MSNENTNLIVAAVLPDGNGGYEPCPDLLTKDEAIRYLRLDTLALKKPANTLRYYRNKGLLNPTPMSNRLFYTRNALNEFLEKITEKNGESI